MSYISYNQEYMKANTISGVIKDQITGIVEIKVYIAKTIIEVGHLV